jgi:hypothetical protein
MRGGGKFSRPVNAPDMHADLIPILLHTACKSIFRSSVRYWNVSKHNEKLAVPTQKIPLDKKPSRVVYWPTTFDDQCTFFAFNSFKTRTINLCEEMRHDFSTVFPAGKPVASMIGTRFPFGNVVAAPKEIHCRHRSK